MIKTAALNNGTGLSRKDTTISLLIIGCMFFIIGTVSWVNAILIPYFKVAFQLNHDQSYFVTLAFYISYLFISLPASYLLKKVGFKKGLMIALWVMAFGTLLFVPAAHFSVYAIFLVGLFSIGTGLAILQTAINPYVTILGPQERAAQRISMMGICNKTAGILAPLVFAWAILRPTDNDLFKQIPGMAPAEREVVLHELIRRVMVPYSIVSGVLLLLGLFVRYSPLPEIDTEHESQEMSVANSDKNYVLQFPQLALGALALFLHLITQILSIDTVINYAQSMGKTLVEAKSLPSITLFSTMVGYLIGIIGIPKLFSQKTALKFCSILGIVLSLLVVTAKGDFTVNIPFINFNHTYDLSIWFLCTLGLANSLIWAGIWPLALNGLGRFTKVGASVMIMMLVANAAGPTTYSLIAGQIGLREAYWIMVPCFIFIVFYAFSGHKIKKW